MWLTTATRVDPADLPHPHWSAPILLTLVLPRPTVVAEAQVDATTGRYNLSWKTPKSITGCQEMLLRSTGGVERTVRFRFK